MFLTQKNRMSQYKIYNDIKYSPNMWVPKEKLFNIPKISTFSKMPNSDRLIKHTCRLCMLFPKIHVHNIIKILKSCNYNLIDTIDTLLFIQDIQKHYQRKQYMKFRKSSCARCVPRKKTNLLEHMLEEPASGSKNIFTNITYSKFTTVTNFDHNININNYLQVNSYAPYTNIVHEEGVVNVDSPTPCRPIRLKVQKIKPGEYCSSIIP